MRLDVCPIGSRVVIRRDRGSEDQYWCLRDGQMTCLEKPLSARRTDAQSLGHVEAVGPEVKTLRPGDRVVFAAVAGLDFLGNDRLIMHEADVLAVLRETP